MLRLKLCASLAGALLWGCSPVLDWREVRPERSGAAALFPCKPKSLTRSALLAGAPVSMTLVSCQVEGMTFAVSHADLGDPSRVTLALVELRSALAANLGASDVRTEPFGVAGMTPNAEAVRLRITGHLPDATPAQERAALFARGTRVFQVAVVGTHLDEVAANAFFESLRLPS
jgi:hypothetical protein